MKTIQPYQSSTIKSTLNRATQMISKFHLHELTVSPQVSAVVDAFVKLEQAAAGTNPTEQMKAAHEIELKSNETPNVHFSPLILSSAVPHHCPPTPLSGPFLPPPAPYSSPMLPPITKKSIDHRNSPLHYVCIRHFSPNIHCTCERAKMTCRFTDEQLLNLLQHIQQLQ
jgi:hypothetical protein